MLQYLYSDSIELEYSIVEDVQTLAKQYELKQLEAICASTKTYTIIPPSTLNSDMKYCLHNKYFSDLTFEVEGTQYFAHKAVVCARSEYFRSMLMSGFREAEQQKIILRDIEFNVFVQLMQFLITDIVDLEPQTLFDLMCQSNLFSLKNLQHRCEKHLLGYVDLTNACLLYESSGTYNADELKQVTLDFIKKNWFEVTTTEAFQKLQSSTVKELNEIMEKIGKNKSAQVGLISKETKSENCEICGLPFVYNPTDWKKRKLQKNF